MAVDDAAPLDEVDLPLECCRGVMVEPDDEPSLHLQACVLQFSDIAGQVAIAILTLAAFIQARAIRGLDANKDLVEARPAHELHEFGIIRQINRHLGQQWCGTVVLLPVRHGREQVVFDCTAMADQVVIDKEHRPVPARGLQGIEFPQHLCPALAARRPPPSIRRPHCRSRTQKDSRVNIARSCTRTASA